MELPSTSMHFPTSTGDKRRASSRRRTRWDSGQDGGENYEGKGLEDGERARETAYQMK